MIHPHQFEFAPTANEEGWASGWSINDGIPRVWWWARLQEQHAVLLSDGEDARKLPAVVTVAIGTESPLGKTIHKHQGGEEASWGHFAYSKQDELKVFLHVSQESFDRILTAVQIAGPPKLYLGFGRDGPFHKLTGAVTQDHDLTYRWHNDSEPIVNIEACDIAYSKKVPERSAPELPDKVPALLRGLGGGFAVAINLIALLIAVAMFSAASSKFETATVSVLLLIYLNVVTRGAAVVRTLLQMELAAIVRFFQLRELAGAPKSAEERSYLTEAEKRLAKPGATYWINAAANSIIALIAVYKLTTLFL